LLRSNSRTPSKPSSWRISALNAGCDRWQAAAARVKLRSAASVMKACSCRLVRLICIADESIPIFDFTA
jgi:hypothetical protein